MLDQARLGPDHATAIMMINGESGTTSGLGASNSDTEAVTSPAVSESILKSMRAAFSRAINLSNKAKYPLI
jgi:hypothetical protein